MANQQLLGDFAFEKRVFPEVDQVLQAFQTKEFLSLSDRERSNKVNQTLLSLIQKREDPCFLLSAVLDFVERIDSKDILAHYTFTSFELWLNQYSQLSFEENSYIRGKIVGKWIPREDYQVLFPIGMEKVYEGTHFVTAHKSPDLDTTIASFWGWVDAFAARVGDGLHIWNVPGGPPSSQIEIELIFKQIFGEGVFTHLVKTRTALTITGNDLLTQKGVVKRFLSDKAVLGDRPRSGNAVVIVDEKGFYLGDWRNIDGEGVRQIVMLLNNCLRWFENNLHVHLISLFAKPILLFDDIPKFLEKLFGLKLKDCEPAKEYGEEQKKHLQTFLSVVLGVEKGLEATFEELGLALLDLSIIEFAKAEDIIQSIKKIDLFDASHKLVEDRPKIFFYLEKVIKGLHDAVQNVRLFMERLDIALQIKTQVFGYSPHFVTVRADVDEIRRKMGSYQHLTVVYPDQGKFFPVGVVSASSLRKTTLGTVSLRDFCNREEMTIPSYLEVISVIDHHKSALSTFTPPMAIIKDAQSSNALVAEMAFLLNDRYSFGGFSKETIEKQIEEGKNSSLSRRIHQKLLQKKQALETKGNYFIHVEREWIEYIHFLYGILDDTDLLTKVSNIDVDCVAQLLNRMKSLQEKKEVEIISLEDLPRDKNFAVAAAKRILQNEDLYSLYQKVFLYREKEIEKNITLCAKDKPSTLFVDTKEQNKCCRVGQTKLFANNIALFTQHLPSLRKHWQSKGESVYEEHPEMDLHLHMISTIVSADEVYQGKQTEYQHKDELWIWIPFTDLAIEHLKSFLSAFQDCPQLKNKEIEVEFLGERAEEFEQIFQESFLSTPTKISKDKSLSLAVIRYQAGILNSRKAMVSPYLPILSQ